MATRFRKHRSSSTKRHGRKALKTRKHGGKWTNVFTGRKSPITSTTATVNAKPALNKNELAANIHDLMDEYKKGLKYAQVKGIPESHGMKTAWAAIEKKIGELRNVDPSHRLVGLYNNLKSQTGAK